MTLPARGNLYLTGFMGCGKSTAGRAIAQRAGRHFVDTDGLVERATGLPISTMFRTMGQRSFRRWESAVLEQVVRQEGCVVALGGGTLLEPVHVAWVLGSGIVVYLQASVQTILVRLAMAGRPMLEDCPSAQVPLRIATLFAEREPGYLCAHVRIGTDERSLGEVVEAVLQEVLSCRG